MFITLEPTWRERLRSALWDPVRGLVRALRVPLKRKPRERKRYQTGSRRRRFKATRGMRRRWKRQGRRAE